MAQDIIQYVSWGPITEIFGDSNLIYESIQAYTANKYGTRSPNSKRILCLNKGLIARVPLRVNIP